MRPVSQAFLDEVKTSHQIATLIEVINPDGDVLSEVTATVNGTVTLDATAASRGRLDVEFVDDGTLGLVPTSSASLLAPYGNELRVSRGVAYPGGSDELATIGVYRIDNVTTQDTGSAMVVRVSGMDRSARLIDARFEEPYQIAAGTNYATAIQATLQLAIPNLPVNFTTTPLTTPQLIANEGDDRWAFCQSMAASCGMVLYFDGDGTAVLRPAAILGDDQAVFDLVEGEAGVLIEAGREWTRQGAFNRVIATGENTGVAVPVRGVATDLNPLSPTYYYGPFGPVPRFFSSQMIATAEQAADAAEAMLNRELGTTQRVNLGAVVNPALEPDDVVRIRRERLGIDEDHILDQVTIPLSAEGSWTARTRSTQVIV